MLEPRWIDDRHALIEGALRVTMAAVPGPARLREAMTYSVLAGGKRLRPLLVLAAAEAVGGDAASVLVPAQAVELIHTFSLIHDDLPCMDDDELRRGRPTCHKAFDESTALLAGDALLCLAFELCAGGADGALAARLVRELATATGSNGMVGGQILDLAGEGQHLGREALEAVHALKTGALIVCSVRLGALGAGADEVALERLTSFARDVGLAFQIADDVLDVVGDRALLGKPVGGDARNEKSTFAALLGVDGARAEARRLLERALCAVASFGEAGEPLRILATRAVERDR